MSPTIGMISTLFKREIFKEMCLQLYQQFVTRSNVSVLGSWTTNKWVHVLLIMDHCGMVHFLPHQDVSGHYLMGTRYSTQHGMLFALGTTFLIFEKPALTFHELCENPEG